MVSIHGTANPSSISTLLLSLSRKRKNVVVVFSSLVVFQRLQSCCCLTPISYQYSYLIMYMDCSTYTQQNNVFMFLFFWRSVRKTSFSSFFSRFLRLVKMRRNTPSNRSITNKHTQIQNSWEDHTSSYLLQRVLEGEMLRSHGGDVGGQSDRVEMGRRKLQCESEAHAVHVFGV